MAKPFLIYIKFISCCFLLGLCGCASFYYPTLPNQVLSFDEVKQVVQELSVKSKEVQSFKGLASVRINYDEDSYAYRYAISAKNDKHLRIDILPKMGAFTLGILVATPNGVQFIDPNKKESYNSDEQKVLVEKALGVPLDGAELLAYFSSRIPNESLEKGVKYNLISGYRDVDGSIWLVWSDKQYYWKVDPEKFLLQEFYMYNQFNKTLVLRIDYSNYFKSGDVELGRTLNLELPKQSVKALINFSTALFNVEIPENKFQIELPREYKRHRIR